TVPAAGIRSNAGAPLARPGRDPLLRVGQPGVGRHACLDTGEQGRVAPRVNPGGAMPEHCVRVVRDVFVPMRDGVSLAGNLYLPVDVGRFPALLMYTPYLKDGPGGRGPVEVVQESLARRGYACLTLDMRGFGASEGRAGPPFSPIERRDGFDALEWVAAQSWCTGKTGMWGISYGG